MLSLIRLDASRAETLIIDKDWQIEADFIPIRVVFWYNFDFLDSGKKNYLTRKDFHQSFLVWLGGLRYFSEIDTNDDGKISREEMAVFCEREEIKRKNHFVEQWRKRDINRDGKLSRNEMRWVSELSANFEEIDLDNDQHISPNEFIKMLAEEMRLK